MPLLAGLLEKKCEYNNLFQALIWGMELAFGVLQSFCRFLQYRKEEK